MHLIGAVLAFFLVKQAFFKATVASKKRLGIFLSAISLPAVIAGYVLIDQGTLQDSTSIKALIIVSGVVLFFEGISLIVIPLFWRSSDKIDFPSEALRAEHKASRRVNLIALPILLGSLAISASARELAGLLGGGGNLIELLEHFGVLSAISGLVCLIAGLGRYVTDHGFIAYMNALSGKVSQ